MFGIVTYPLVLAIGVFLFSRSKRRIFQILFEDEQEDVPPEKHLLSYLMLIQGYDTYSNKEWQERMEDLQSIHMTQC